MDMMRKLSDAEAKNVRGGEAITLAAILALMSVAIVTVVCYKLFFSNKSKVALPGGFTFTWE